MCLNQVRLLFGSKYFLFVCLFVCFSDQGDAPSEILQFTRRKGIVKSKALHQSLSPASEPIPALFLLPPSPLSRLYILLSLLTQCDCEGSLRRCPTPRFLFPPLAAWIPKIRNLAEFSLRRRIGTWDLTEWITNDRFSRKAKLLGSNRGKGPLWHKRYGRGGNNINNGGRVRADE